MSLPRSIEQNYFPSLDGFRALAISTVLISHIYYGRNNVFSTFLSGAWGVNLFFVISGFLITTLLIKERARTGTVSLVSFYTRRALRIFPAAFLFLSAMVILNREYDLGITLSNFITAALYVKNLPISTGGSGWYLGHFWSLSAEEQYYLLIPGLLSIGYLAFRRAAVALIVLAHLAIVLHFHWGKDSVALAWATAILGNQISLLVGSLAAWYACDGKLIAKPVSSATSVALLFASMALHAGFVPALPTTLATSLSAVCLAYLVVGSIQKSDSVFFRILNSTPMKKIGLLSYSVYLWQQIFTYKPFIITLELNTWLAVIVNLAALGIVSVASYYCVERYFLRLKTRFVRT